ncbi:MAG: bifunctional 3-(3-hydroxy-phenyl)propionate/3-hydroxycinnamic acid hydroxylase [Candidatus Puniceispirillaceae bacterium]
MAKTEYEVAIVGLGPTGATLANILAGYGIDVLVLEREEAVYPLPRAVHFDDEAMRVFQSIGLADAIGRDARVNVGTKFVDRDQNLLLDWPRPQEVGPLGWYPSYRFHQPDLEADLNRGIAACDSVTLQRSAHVTQVSDKGDSVEVSYLRDDVPQKVTADYVIGTDGAKSVVRQAMDSDWEDLGFQERWLVIDVQLKRPRPDLGDFTIQTCDRDRPTTYVRCPREWRRWEISLRPDETREEVTRDAFIWPRLRPAITPEDGDIARRAVYSFESKLAKRWRQGRLMIAGDAAHLMPPFLGQGMCTGIRDVANLAWKLVARLRWNAPDSLVDSYEAERRTHTRTYIETAVNVGEMMNSAETAEALTHAIRPDGAAQMNSISRDLDPAIGPRGDAMSGIRMPQPWLADGRRLGDVMAGRCALITRNGVPAGNMMPEHGMIVIDASAHEELRAMLDERGLSALILRPDFYCFGAAGAGDGHGLESLIDSFRQQVFR